MNDRFIENLGPPDIKMKHLDIWVHGRESFIESDDYWNANWLRATAHCSFSGARVTASGSILHLSEIHSWLTELETLYGTLSGTAKLDCMEPELSVTITAHSLGRMEANVSITPDHLNQQHQFTFEIDQSYLPLIINNLRSVLNLYPIKNIGT